MAGFCLIKPLADKFKQALVSGKVDPAKLSQMTSEERHAFFTDLLGEEIKKLNINIDALVNNAGIILDGDDETAEIDKIRKTLEIYRSQYCRQKGQYS